MDDVGYIPIDRDADDGFPCVVTTFDSPSDFTVQLITGDAMRYSDQIERICGRASTDDSLFVEWRQLTVGMFVIARWISGDRHWHRAQITNIDHDTHDGDQRGPQISVRFIDYGNSEDLTSMFLRFAPRPFYAIPRLSYRCRLSGIKHPQKPAEMWSEFEVDMFQSIITLNLQPYLLFPVQQIVSQTGERVLDVLLENQTGVPSAFNINENFAELVGRPFPFVEARQAPSPAAAATATDRQRIGNIGDGGTHPETAHPPGRPIANAYGPKGAARFAANAGQSSQVVGGQLANAATTRSTQISSAATTSTIAGVAPRRTDAAPGGLRDRYVSPLSYWDDADPAELDYRDAFGREPPSANATPNGVGGGASTTGDDDRRVEVFTHAASELDLPTKGSIHIVDVTTVYSANNFYCTFPYGTGPQPDEIDISGPTPVKQLCDEMTAYYRSSGVQRVDPELGEIVVVKHPRNGCFYRARVVDEVNATDGDQGHFYRVFCVDVGHKSKVISSDIMHIDERHLQMPFQAVNCRLANIQPPCSPEMNQQFLDLISPADKKLLCKLWDIEEDALVVDLFDTADGDARPVCISDVLNGGRNITV